MRDSSPNGRPPRSTAGERFDPPVAVVRFTVARSRTGADVERELTDRAQLTAAAFARTVRHGGIWIDRRPVPIGEPPAELEVGQTVAIYTLAREPEPIALPASALLLDRDGIVAVAKPAWLPVQGTRASRLYSLEALLRSLLDAPGLHGVHRLDRQTSGAVLFARDTAVAGRLGRALAAHAIARTYLAVVSPVPEQRRFAVTGELAPAADPPRWRFELHTTPVPGSRPSATHFRVLAREADRALLECAPQTGRTHQIRVHLASVGTPILGDELYGKPSPAEGVERTLLHAWKIAGSVLPGEIEASLPEDFPVTLLDAARRVTT